MDLPKSTGTLKNSGRGTPQDTGLPSTASAGDIVLAARTHEGWQGVGTVLKESEGGIFIHRSRHRQQQSIGPRTINTCARPAARSDRPRCAPHRPTLPPRGLAPGGGGLGAVEEARAEGDPPPPLHYGTRAGGSALSEAEDHARTEDCSAPWICTEHIGHVECVLGRAASPGRGALGARGEARRRARPA